MRHKTQGLTKVESSMLKECGDETARGVFQPKCRCKKIKVNSFPFLHFFSSLWFFFLSFLLLKNEKMPRRKHLKWKGKNKRLEAGAKGKKVEWELERKFLPFSAFFFFFVIFFNLFAWKQEDAKRKHLKQKGRNERAEAGAKSERAK